MLVSVHAWTTGAVRMRTYTRPNLRMPVRGRAVRESRTARHGHHTSTWLLQFPPGHPFPRPPNIVTATPLRSVLSPNKCSGPGFGRGPLPPWPSAPLPLCPSSFLDPWARGPAAHLHRGPAALCHRYGMNQNHSTTAPPPRRTI